MGAVPHAHTLDMLAASCFFGNEDEDSLLRAVFPPIGHRNIMDMDMLYEAVEQRQFSP